MFLFYVVIPHKIVSCNRRVAVAAQSSIITK